MDQMKQFETRDGKSYPILFNVNAICQAQDTLDMGLAQMLQHIVAADLRPVRVLLWAGLEGARLRMVRDGDTPPQTKAYTLSQAGDILDETPGGASTAARWLIESSGLFQVLNQPGEKPEAEPKNGQTADE